MQHNLFKPENLEQAKGMVTGDCNGISTNIRYEQETPVFAQKILKWLNGPGIIVDYGCGCGRLAKEILEQSPLQRIFGMEPSAEMRQIARANVDNLNFKCLDIEECQSIHFADIVVLVYVLQHIPAIEIRGTLARIYSYLKPGGYLFYCGSDVRMAVRYDTDAFFDDRFLGVNLQAELTDYFELVCPVFIDEELENNLNLKSVIVGPGVAHPALVWRKR